MEPFPPRFEVKQMAPLSFPLGWDEGFGIPADLSEEIASQTIFSPPLCTRFHTYIPDLPKESKRYGTSS